MSQNGSQFRLPDGRERSDLPLESITQFIFGYVELEVLLQAKPELGRRSEEPREPQRRVGSDTTLLKHDLVDAPRMHSDGKRQTILAQSHRPQEFLHQHLTRVYRL